METISVVMPTWNGAEQLSAVLAALRRQTRPPGEILVVDSGSTDGTAEIARQAGCRVRIIEQAEFNHGGTRNQAALAAQGSILVFMTQDALPANNCFLEQLTEPVRKRTAAAAYARQLPRPGASPLEQFQRWFHYPDPDALYAETGGAGVRLRCFASNTAMAVRREIFLAVGGFPPWVILGEDMILSAKLQQGGHVVAYAAASTVIHSHPYSARQQFHRYFDVGAALAAASSHLELGETGADGRRYAQQLLRYLGRSGQRHWIPAAIAELGAKWIGYHLGREHRFLPRWVKSKWSLQPRFWQTPTRRWEASDPKVLDQARATSAAAGAPSLT